MTPSDIQTYSGLIDKAGAIAVLVAVVLALATAVRWLLKLLLERQDKAIAYREEQIKQLQAQHERTQDLFDQALDMLKEDAAARRGAARGGR